MHNTTQRPQTAYEPIGKQETAHHADKISRKGWRKYILSKNGYINDEKEIQRVGSIGRCRRFLRGKQRGAGKAHNHPGYWEVEVDVDVESDSTSESSSNTIRRMTHLSNRSKANRRTGNRKWWLSRRIKALRKRWTWRNRSGCFDLMLLSLPCS